MKYFTQWHPDNKTPYRYRIPEECAFCDKTFKFVHQCLVNDDCLIAESTILRFGLKKGRWDDSFHNL